MSVLPSEGEREGEWWGGSNLHFYLAVNRLYQDPDYLRTVTDQTLRQILTMYRLSDHTQQRLEAETESLPATAACFKKEEFFSKIKYNYQDFKNCHNSRRGKEIF